jgi:Domain of unknown function (DUF4232)
MRLRTCVSVIAASGLVAACGGGASSSSHAVSATPVVPATTTAAPASTPPTTASPPATNPASSTTPAAASGSGPGPCRAGGLTLIFLGGQGATGHGELGFALRNTSSSPCRTFGYPGVQFLDQSGRALPTVPAHTTQDFFGSLPLRRLIVAPGSAVSFRLGVTHGAASTAGCATAYGLQVIPPDDTVSVRTSIPGGAYECQTTTVSPLQAGTSAYS